MARTGTFCTRSLLHFMCTIASVFKNNKRSRQFGRNAPLSFGRNAEVGAKCSERGISIDMNSSNRLSNTEVI